MSVNGANYTLFPYTTLSEKESRHLSLLLPRLCVLQVIRPPALSEWLQEQVAGWSVITEQRQLERIAFCLKGYQQFAAVHGENSALASLSLDQISRSFAETRFRIQDQLKQDDSDELDAWEKSLMEAAIFLELARDLDEKEIDLETSFTKIHGLEGEFREILGISDEEELADSFEILSPPLRTERVYLSFMLPKRIESWLRLFFNQMPRTSTTLVTTSQQVVEELFEPVRGEYDRLGKTFEPDWVVLGSIPVLDDLRAEEFVNLLSNPEASGMVTSYWDALEKVLHSPRDLFCRTALSEAMGTLQDFLRHYRSEMGLAEGAEISMDLVFENEMRWSNLAEGYERAGKSKLPADGSYRDDLLTILVCRY
jgi:hypothetical protein